MSARLARSAFNAASRRAAPTARMAPRVAKRNMSTVGDTAHAVKTSSDKPWIIAAAVVFGPAFLYLVSPSARKNRHDFHDDKHDFPGYTPHEKVPASEHESSSTSSSTPVLMKDSEGVEADVSQSVAIAEKDDAPKQAPSPESQPTAAATESRDATEKPAGESTDKYYSGEQKQTYEAKSDAQIEGTGKKSSTWSGDETGPSDQGLPRLAGQKGITPKEKAEGADETK